MTPEQKEQEYVHNVYQAIAPHFSATRYKPWPVVEEFLLTMPSGYIGADVGCGNGKYIGVNSKLFIHGSDRSSNLISICGERGHEAMDFAISIAVIHHFISPERRVAAIDEILRVVRIGGKILIFVWALEQTGKRDFDKNTQDVFVPWAMPKKAEARRDRTRSRPQGVRRRDRLNTTTTLLPSSTTDETTVADSMDQLTLQTEQTESSTAAATTATTDPQSSSPEPVPEPISSSSALSSSTGVTTTATQDAEENSDSTTSAPSESAAPVYNRYYHLFQKGELEDLILRTNKASIVQSGYDRDNWWCILEKTDH
ncbi:tRNA methyltransferase, has a role in tRNA modification [Entomortierella lignicola]|nr:tRNA methyltransferase, has a role in tRNA modification [Entomortierella lignicola]